MRVRERERHTHKLQSIHTCKNKFSIHKYASGGEHKEFQKIALDFTAVQPGLVSGTLHFAQEQRCFTRKR